MFHHVLYSFRVLLHVSSTVDKKLQFTERMTWDVPSQLVIHLVGKILSWLAFPGMNGSWSYHQAPWNPCNQLMVKMGGLGWWFGLVLETTNLPLASLQVQNCKKICKHLDLWNWNPFQQWSNNGKKTLKIHGLDMSSIPGEWIQKFPPVKLRVS